MKIGKYHHYNFTGQDPVIGKLHRMRGNSLRNSELSKESGVSQTTYSNWWSGRTKRPKFATVIATARAMGADFVLVKKR